MELRLSSDAVEALQAYWRFFEPRSAHITAQIRRYAAASPVWGPVVAGIPSVQESADRKLQRAAIIEGKWAPYLESLRAQGAHYARSGVAYDAWFELFSAMRDVVHAELAQLGSASEALTASQGLNRLIDIAIQNIGEAYIEAKDELAATSENRYRAMFLQSPLPMWMYDRETLRFVAVNDAALAHYGYTRDEMLALTIADIRPPEDLSALKNDVAHAGGYAPRRQWRHRKRDGSMILVEIEANDFRDADRDVRLVLITDVTERERAAQALRKTEEQLRNAQKMDAIGQLAGGVAHDFNNVLSVILSYSSFLEEALEATDPRHEDAAEIRRAAERGSAITRQLLAVSRHSIAAPRSVLLHQVVKDFDPMLRRLAGERVRLTTRLETVPAVIADPGQLEQVLMNLAVNARDAMPEGGRLTIETAVTELDAERAAPLRIAAGPYVVVSVTDSGTGMDRETQARIFEPFFTTKETGKGTGLGLAIVHGIVAQAGGAISVYSELGHGTAVRVHLPVATRTVAAPDDARAPAPVRLPPLTILVVDDTRAVRAATARILVEAGCRVLEAASAEEARRIVVTHDGEIDLVLIDVVLTDGRGDVLLGELRELRPGLKSVIMSGYPAGALTPHGGVPPDLLAKPFSPAELRASVARVVGTVPAAVERAAPSSVRVLVVDDDEVLRRSLARALRKSDLDVTEADCGSKATGELERAAFDVVLSDVHMPDGTGLDLMRAARRVDLDVPVILVSGAPDLESAAEAVEYGAFRYVTKPFDIMAMVKLVKHAARAHALARLRREALVAGGSQSGAVDRAGLEVRFEQALDRMWMAYQPIVDAKTGALYAVEALMRSNEPSMANPMALLDAATQLQRLAALGRRVRELSATAIAPRDDVPSLFINLHPDDLFDAELIAATSPLVAMAPRVVLEITERASLATSPELTERLARLRALGFRLAVDDIGAGYSGLTSFTELMPEVVKIDMSLVRDVHVSALKQRTIAALCRLCHEVGVLVVGEGVETVEERECLVGLGCDLLQGYLIGRPGKEPVVR